MASTKHKLQAHLLASVFYVLLIMPMQTTEDCECKSESQKDDGKSKAALDLKLTAIASILVASAIGVCLPILGKSIPALQPEKDMFFVIKSFAAGVILATGMIHVLPDAFENLTSECLKKPWSKFPFAGFIAMLSAIATLMIDASATAYYKRQMGDAGEMDVERNAAHTHATHGHAYGNVSASHGWKSADLVRQRVVSQVLELGIVVHSVIIGISMGTSEKPRTIRPLVAAFCFHQLFEGMGLGGCIVQAKFRARSVVIMVLFFALTTPVGIALGIAISSVYKENSPTALIVEGIFNAASAGILVYMALVDLLAVDFMDPRIQCNGKLQLWVNASLLIGAGCMSVMAKWA